MPACVVMPADPFAAAQKSLKDGDLLDTLLYLDQVPPNHHRYADARSIAQAVERRMRTAHKLLGRGMALRAEWRDEEAIDLFEQSLSVWARVSGARELIQATEHRISALQPEEDGQASADGIGVAGTMPIGFPVPGPNPEPGPGAVMPPADEEGGSEIESATPPDVQARTRVALDLLQRGQLERALDLLEGLHAELPSHPEVAESLVRVLNQRALLHYGQGDLELALNDWTRVLRLDPSHEQARGFLIAAQAELKSLRR
jgi:tetratricopeptide (TPR) repeat protein